MNENRARRAADALRDRGIDARRDNGGVPGRFPDGFRFGSGGQ